MITCNLFQLRVDILNHDDSIVIYDLLTDLPPGTRVIVTCQRTYLNATGSPSVWIGHDEMFALEGPVIDGFCHHHGRIDIVSSDQQALELFKSINSSGSPGISTSVSEEVTIILTVGARQRLREFGKHNANLVGTAVLESGVTRYVEISQNITIPMKPAFQPSSGRSGFT